MLELNIDPEIEYRELGYEIYPVENSKYEGHFEYPTETVLILPKGSTITKVMSQRDSVRWGIFDDILRVYALVPSKTPRTEKHTILVYRTGETFKLPKRVQKIDTIKEYEGEWVFHVYHVPPSHVGCAYPLGDGGPCNISEEHHYSTVRGNRKSLFNHEFEAPEEQ